MMITNIVQSKHKWERKEECFSNAEFPQMEIIHLQIIKPVKDTFPLLFKMNGNIHK